jgi:hypothetical protein
MCILGKDDRMFENRAIGQADCYGRCNRVALTFEKAEALDLIVGIPTTNKPVNSAWPACS